MDCLYTVTEVEDGRVHLHLCGTHPLYEGHFPGQPVCPGVMTMQMVRECASRHEGRLLRWKGVKSCRFTGMLYPGDDVTLVMNTLDDGVEVVLDAEIEKTAADGAAVVVLTLKGTLI